MAAKKPEMNELNLEQALTFVSEEKKPEYNGPKVMIYLPKLEDEGNGVKVDQYEHVTIANELGEKTFRIRRGERVEIPVYIYPILKEKYPDI